MRCPRKKLRLIASQVNLLKVSVSQVEEPLVPSDTCNEALKQVEDPRTHIYISPDQSSHVIVSPKGTRDGVCTRRSAE
jgi:hypothetical protein